jgi:hypothetical protein
MSQVGTTPSNMSQQSGSAPASRAPSPIRPQSPARPRRQHPARPAFTAADEDNPTRGELITYVELVETYLNHIKFTYTFLKVNEGLWPPDIVTAVAANITRAGTIWRRVAEYETLLSQYETVLAEARLSEAREQAANVRAASGTAPMQQARPQRTKNPNAQQVWRQKGGPSINIHSSMRQLPNNGTQCIHIGQCMHQMGSPATRG